jgi:subtilase family serine protease
MLQLKRSSAQQQLEQLAAEVSDPSSQNYRQFLTAAQFAAAYGSNSQDVQTIGGWLQSRGLPGQRGLSIRKHHRLLQ